MAHVLYPIKGTGLYRDKYDRVFAGPFFHAEVEGGREYYSDVGNRQRIFVEQAVIGTAWQDVEPEPTLKENSEASGVCEVCGTPLNESQLKKGGKYCSKTCRVKAANQRAAAKKKESD